MHVINAVDKLLNLDILQTNLNFRLKIFQCDSKQLKIEVKQLKKKKNTMIPNKGSLRNKYKIREWLNSLKTNNNYFILFIQLYIFLIIRSIVLEYLTKINKITGMIY